MTRKWIACAIAAIALASAACGAEIDGGSDLSGSIEIDGSSTVFPITEAVAEEFGAEVSDVQVKVGQSGTGGGFEKFCDGVTDVSNASRPIKDEEAALCADKNIEYVEMKVAIDGLSVVVNKQNTFAECLATAELTKVWEPGSTVKSWKDIKGDWPDQPIKLYGPGADSGTFDYFTDEINGEEGKSRSDYQASEDDNVLVQGVAGDQYSLGYFGYAYYTQNTDKLNTVAVDGGDGCVQPTQATIEDGSYKPLSRPLYIYASKEALARAEVKAFVEFYLDSVGDLLTDVGYIPLPAADLDASKQALEEATA